MDLFLVLSNFALFVLIVLSGRFYYLFSGEAARDEHEERRTQLQVRAEGEDQAGAGHVQRRAHVQDDGVYAQVLNGPT